MMTLRLQTVSSTHFQLQVYCQRLSSLHHTLEIAVKINNLDALIFTHLVNYVTSVSVPTPHMSCVYCLTGMVVGENVTP